MLADIMRESAAIHREQNKRTISLLEIIQDLIYLREGVGHLEEVFSIPLQSTDAPIIEDEIKKELQGFQDEFYNWLGMMEIDPSDRSVPQWFSNDITNQLRNSKNAQSYDHPILPYIKKVLEVIPRHTKREQQKNKKDIQYTSQLRERKARPSNSLGSTMLGSLLNTFCIPVLSMDMTMLKDKEEMLSQFLSGMLKTLNEESNLLLSEPESSLTPLRKFLHLFLSGTSHRDVPATLESLAISNLMAMTITNGGPNDVLSFSKSLLETSARTHVTFPVGDVLVKWSSSIQIKSKHSDIWGFATRPEASFFLALPYDRCTIKRVSSAGSITTDGSRLYLFSEEEGLTIVGLGYFRNIRREVYPHSLDLPRGKGWIMAIKGHLYFRSSVPQKGLLRVFECEGLTETSPLLDPEFESTINNAHIVDIISNGFKIYFILKEKDAMHPTVTNPNPSTPLSGLFCHAFEVEGNRLVKVLTTYLQSTNREFSERRCFATDGARIVLLEETHADASSPDVMEMWWDTDGNLVQNRPPHKLPQGFFMCYDGLNKLLYNYSEQLHLVEVWGSQRPATVSGFPEYSLEGLVNATPPHQMTAEHVIIYYLAKMTEITYHSMQRNPFYATFTSHTFELLTGMLQVVISRVQASNKSEDWTILFLTLDFTHRLLRNYGKWKEEKDLLPEDHKILTDLGSCLLSTFAQIKHREAQVKIVSVIIAGFHLLVSKQHHRTLLLDTLKYWTNEPTSFNALLLVRILRKMNSDVLELDLVVQSDVQEEGQFQLFNTVVRHTLGDLHRDQDPVQVELDNFLLEYIKMMFSQQNPETRKAFFRWLKCSLPLLLNPALSILDRDDKPLLKRILPFYILALGTAVERNSIQMEAKKDESEMAIPSDELFGFYSELKNILLPLLRVLDEKNCQEHYHPITPELRTIQVDLGTVGELKTIHVPGAESLVIYVGRGDLRQATLTLYSDKSGDHCVTQMTGSFDSKHLRVVKDVVSFKMDNPDPSHAPLILPTLTVLGQAHWMVDMETTVADLVSKCAARLVVASPTIDTERHFGKHLNSDLLSKGLEDYFYKKGTKNLLEDKDLPPEEHFLEDFVHDRTNTPGGELYKWLYNHIIALTPMGKRGGSHVDAAERAVIAAYIKHSGITKTAIAFAEEVQSNSNASLSLLKAPPKLRDACLEVAKRFRQWIIQRRQVLTRSDSGQVDAADPEEKKFPFPVLVQEIIAKSRLLLRYCPLTPDANKTQPTSPVTVALKRTASVTDEDLSTNTSRSNRSQLYSSQMITHDTEGRIRRDSSSDRPQNSRFVELWDRIQRRSKQHKDADQEMETDENPVLSALLKWVELPLSIVDMFHMMEVRRNRLQARKEGIHAFHQMISTISLASIREYVTKHLPQALKQIQDLSTSDSVPSMCGDISPCNASDEHRLESSLEMLFKGLSNDLVRGSHTSLPVILSVIDAWRSIPRLHPNRNFIENSRILEFLKEHMIPDALRTREAEKKRKQGAIPPVLRLTSFSLFSYLATTCFLDGSNTDEPTKIQRNFVDIVLEELKKVVDVLQKKKRDLSQVPKDEKSEVLEPTSSPPSAWEGGDSQSPEILEVTEEFISVERWTYELLSLLGYLLQVKPLTYVCNSLDVAHLLLRLITLGTPRIQRASTRLCRRVLASQQPYMLGKFAAEGSDKKGIIPFFLERIAAAVYSPLLFEYTPPAPPSSKGFDFLATEDPFEKQSRDSELGDQPQSPPQPASTTSSPFAVNPFTPPFEGNPFSVDSPAVPRAQPATMEPPSPFVFTPNTPVLSRASAPAPGVFTFSAITPPESFQPGIPPFNFGTPSTPSTPTLPRQGEVPSFGSAPNSPMMSPMNSPLEGRRHISARRRGAATTTRRPVTPNPAAVKTNDPAVTGTRFESAAAKLVVMATQHMGHRYCSQNSYQEQSLASELVMLLRYLASNSELWRAPLLDELNSALSQAPKINQSIHALIHSEPSEYPLAALSSDLCKLVGALNILGGHIETLRVGAQVMVDAPSVVENDELLKLKLTDEGLASGKLRGHIIKYNIMSLRANVAFTVGNRTKTKYMSVASMVPMSGGKEIVPKFAGLTKDMALSLRPFLSVASPKEGLSQPLNKVLQPLGLLLQGMAVDVISNLVRHSSPVPHPEVLLDLIAPLTEMACLSKLKNFLNISVLCEYATSRRSDLISSLTDRFRNPKKNGRYFPWPTALNVVKKAGSAVPFSSDTAIGSQVTYTDKENPKNQMIGIVVKSLPESQIALIVSYDGERCISFIGWAKWNDLEVPHRTAGFLNEWNVKSLRDVAMENLNTEYCLNSYCARNSIDILLNTVPTITKYKTFGGKEKLVKLMRVIALEETPLPPIKDGEGECEEAPNVFMSFAQLAKMEPLHKQIVAILRTERFDPPKQDSLLRKSKSEKLKTQSHFATFGRDSPAPVPHRSTQLDHPSTSILETPLPEQSQSFGEGLLLKCMKAQYWLDPNKMLLTSLGIAEYLRTFELTSYIIGIVLTEGAEWIRTKYIARIFVEMMGLFRREKQESVKFAIFSFLQGFIQQFSPVLRTVFKIPVQKGGIPPSQVEGEDPLLRSEAEKKVGREHFFPYQASQMATVTISNPTDEFESLAWEIKELISTVLKLKENQDIYSQRLSNSASSALQCMNEFAYWIYRYLLPWDPALSQNFTPECGITLDRFLDLADLIMQISNQNISFVLVKRGLAYLERLRIEALPMGTSEEGDSNEEEKAVFAMNDQQLQDLMKDMKTVELERHTEMIDLVQTTVPRAGFIANVFKLNFSQDLVEERYPHLAKISRGLMLLTWGIIQLLNRNLKDLISDMNLSGHIVGQTLYYHLLKISRLIFIDTKMQFWNELLDRMPCSGSAKMTLDRRDATKGIFIQAWKQLHRLDAALLRSRERAWKVEFVGEGANDAGGPYRESISAICEELQSDKVGLLIPCPNARDGTGQNVDQWILNPSALDAVSLSHFEFFGKLIGIALRTGDAFNLDLSSFFWKQLIQYPLDSSDLFQIDVRVGELLKGLSRGELINEKNITITFTTKLSDNTEVELIPNGRNTSVNQSNVKEYIRLVEQRRLNECQKQIAAIRKGLGSIVPLKLLGLFTWEEIEERACGKPNVDVEALKTFCKLKSHTDEHEAKLFDTFWECLSEMTNRERCMFVRFTCGLSRLPSGYKTDKRLKIIFEHNDNDDNSLPRASTCFWSIYIPKYSSKEIMKKRILTALVHCTDIDADYTINQ
eukprot:TRINITY_DN6796_c0_g1_i1.p1 TRINITY_DN6796_c0_g1~~TRINITY_DN6796_c0_g1_i1.p1  ORF type:complete len:3271 (-),score=955.48 TRINITY_DN6796_c0_g1_i1:39-9716(-)